MGHPEDPVVAFLEDTIARQLRVLCSVELLSQFIDEEEALKHGMEIRNTVLEQYTETLVWRKAREAWTVPELAGEFCAHVNGAVE